MVIIGGGAVGVSALYHLAKAGWTECVLLEKNELTSGSTWHAAGNVPTFSSSWSLMNMQRYSAALYRGLAAEVDYPMNYHVTGSLRLAHTEERMREFQRVGGMGRFQDMGIEVVGVDEIKARYPFIETHDLKGALYDPSDGDIDPAQLTQALAKGARDLGQRSSASARSPRARRDSGEWVLATPQGEIRCEDRRQCRRLPRQGSRQAVRPRRADDGDEPSVHPVRGDPRARRLVDAKPAASCRCCATSTPPTICARRRTA